MSDYILFINSGSDATVANEIYDKNVDIVKIRLHELTTLIKHFPKNKIWIDLAFDGYPVEYDESRWHIFYNKFSLHSVFMAPAFLEAPDKKVVEKHLYEILNLAITFNPAILSVPQINYTNPKFNKINKLMAQIFSKWRTEKQFSGDCILPVIFKNKDSYITGTERTKKLKLIETNFKISGSNSIWLVDSNLQDQLGVGDFEKIRFPALIDLHTKVKKNLSPKYHVAGPYWGLNIVMWARGIVKNPAFALGNGYQHYCPSGFVSNPSSKMVIPSLSRWTKVNTDLRSWLLQSAATLSTTPDGNDFKELVSVFDSLQIKDKYKQQVSKFYLEWFNRYKDLPEAGRAVALYQDLSKSYMIGRSLEDMPNENGTTRKPEIVARQLMMNCL